MNSMVTLPIVKALLVAAQVTGGGSQPEFNPVNKTQASFIQEHVKPGQGHVNKFSKEELAAWADTDIAKLNKILKEKGFSIQLDESAGFGVVSILNVLVKWRKEGERTSLKGADGKSYDAVLLQSGFQTHRVSGHSNPIACIETQSGDKVFMTAADQKCASFELLRKIKHLKEAQKESAGYSRLCFPMVDYNEQARLEWLEGLGVGSNDITEALQQTKFKMNEIGARAESAVALGFRCLPSVMKVNQPFLVWIERPNVQDPVFAGYMDYANWKDPGTLDNK